LHRIITGGEPLGRELAWQLSAFFRRTEIADVYGLTETWRDLDRFVQANVNNCQGAAAADLQWRSRSQCWPPATPSPWATMTAPVLADRQGDRMSTPVPSSASGIAVVGSALLSRNSRAMNATTGKMTSAKTNSASITRWLLIPSRDSATNAKPVASAAQMTLSSTP
jgi:hypothetical protein